MEVLVIECDVSRITLKMEMGVVDDRRDDGKEDNYEWNLEPCLHPVSSFFL